MTATRGEQLDVAACCATGLTAKLERKDEEKIEKVLKEVDEKDRMELVAIIS